MAIQKKINLDRLPSNNIEPIEDRSPITKNVKVREQKRGFADDIRNIALYLYEDVVTPALRDTFYEFFTSGVGMFIFGERSMGHTRGLRGQYHSYQQRPNRYPKARQYEERYERRASYVSPSKAMSLDEIVFTYRDEAEATLGRMLELIAKYGWVSVGDLYSMISWTGSPSDERYGWSSLRNVGIFRVKDGYVIDLPEPSYSR